VRQRIATEAFLAASGRQQRSGSATNRRATAEGRELCRDALAGKRTSHQMLIPTERIDPNMKMRIEDGIDSGCPGTAGKGRRIITRQTAKCRRKPAKTNTLMRAQFLWQQGHTVTTPRCCSRTASRKRRLTGRCRLADIGHVFAQRTENADKVRATRDGR